jgi:hypothetical protein
VKPIKTFSFAVLAALIAMAFVGISPAMAESTSLCSEDPGEGAHEACPESKREAFVHESTSLGTKATLLSSIVTVECNVEFNGSMLSANNLGEPLEILGNFTYWGCKTTSGTECTVTEKSVFSHIQLLKLGHELADVTGSGEVNTHCGSLINCTYNGLGLKGHALGPLLSSTLNGEVRVEEQVVNKTGGTFCPKTAKLDILTTPTFFGPYITE